MKTIYQLYDKVEATYELFEKESDAEQYAKENDIYDYIIVPQELHTTSHENILPEGCVLVAHDTGDGWALGVENQKGDEICLLDWPDSWPERINTATLRKYGFKIV